ncbi:(2Fe-2S)-binding protein [Candidatus Bipolaricaulota bacterium]|nr:(2Fe-2S)-binding protein [Candidatus Bipolaricaulota bacterium]
MKIDCIINGQRVERDIEPDMRLLDFIRETLHLTGTKEGCGEGECGACTVLMDGKAIHSCLILAMQADGAKIVTIEGLAEGHALHPIQQAYVDAGAVQCGFCTPGFIMATFALLQDTPDPSEEEILAGLEGNLCRCTGYAKIVEAVKLSASRLRSTG